MRSSDANTRLAVTGLGIVCSIGCNQKEVWESITHSRAGIARLGSRLAGERFPTDLAAEVQENLAPLLKASKRELRRLSRTDLLALIAAQEAIGQCAFEGELPARTIVSTGTSTGGLLEGENYYFDRLVRGGWRTPASHVLQQPTSAPSDVVARFHGLRGGVFSNATACASAGAAIGLAGDLIRMGVADVAVAGGSDALCRTTYSGFNVLQAVDEEPCTPFGANRRGITLGEGAAYIVIEKWEQAQDRGAKILAELCGYGATCDAYHPTAPAEDGRGASAAMQAALSDGRERPEVEYVNAHGTGTQLNDSAETRAIMTTLGNDVPTSSTKSFFGHTLGASGALEAVVTVLALQHQLAPPTLRLTEAAADCVLDYVPHTPRPMRIDHALSNTFGFGGSNVSLLFRAAR